VVGLLATTSNSVVTSNSIYSWTLEQNSAVPYAWKYGSSFDFDRELRLYNSDSFLSGKSHQVQHKGELACIAHGDSATFFEPKLVEFEPEI